MVVLSSHRFLGHIEESFQPVRQHDGQREKQDGRDEQELCESHVSFPRTAARRAVSNPACFVRFRRTCPWIQTRTPSALRRSWPIQRLVTSLPKFFRRAHQHAVLPEGYVLHTYVPTTRLPRCFSLIFVFLLHQTLYLNICHCQQIKETRRAVKDSESGVEKMAIGHHIHERGHVVEKKYNKKTGDKELNQNFQNMDECTMKRNTSGTAHYALSVNYMLPNIFLTLHPQPKDSHLRMSGSRRCPSFIHPTPRLSWRDRALATCTTPPSPAASSPTGQYHELYTIWNEVAVLNYFPLLLLL